jgi:hypothetical protein
MNSASRNRLLPLVALVLVAVACSSSSGGGGGGGGGGGSGGGSGGGGQGGSSSTFCCEINCESYSCPDQDSYDKCTSTAEDTSGCSPQSQACEPASVTGC